MLIGQLSGGSSPGMLGVALCVAATAGLWTTAFIQSRQKTVSESGRGMTLSFILTGSLLLVAADVYLTGEMTQGMGYSDRMTDIFYAFGLVLLVVALMHALFARLIKRRLVAGLSVLIACISLSAIALGWLSSTKPEGMDMYAMVFIASGALLMAMTRAVARAVPKFMDSQTFDGFAWFVMLTAMAVAGTGDWHALWYLLSIGAVLYLFIVVSSIEISPLWELQHFPDSRTNFNVIPLL